MVLFGLGVLIISLSVLAYRYRTSEETSTKAPKPVNEDHASEQSKECPTPPTPQLEDKKDQDGPSILEAKDMGNNGGRGEMNAVERPDLRLRNEVLIEQELGSRSNETVQTHQSMNSSPSNSVRNQIPKPPQPSLMPPPIRPLPGISPPRGLLKNSTALHPPLSAASSLRVPPSRSLAPPTSSLAPSTSTLSPSARQSKKVLLEPGHSPLDWAHLIANPPSATFLRGSDVPPNLIRVPPSLLRYHSGRKGKDAWGVYQGKVYNLSPYMKFHPGGVDQLMRGAGKDKEGEKLFNEIHPWVSWENMLGECLIGILVSEDEARTAIEGGDNKMEDMD